ncbi:MAG: autorepressor SdpR family transcription factor [Bacillota bacterium]|nr:autorepressor SdpR family transcription factor [Bacillota bacterium]MDD3298116.1 autorepressor SdpR family transcription factor [Bacillota bacterium]MDD4707439.1 autorepressor SdpR family transcription factor [Bacillota bacterium]
MLGDTFKALSDKTRREILLMLKDSDMSAGEIAEGFSTTHATISHHLKMLKDTGLVSVERQGQSIIYSLNTTVFQDLLAWLVNFKE